MVLAISAASQLLSRVDWADLDGAWLLARDPWMGARIEHGTIATREAGAGRGAADVSREAGAAGGRRLA